MTYKDRDRVKAWLDAGHGEKLSTLARIVLVTIAEEVYGNTGLALPGHELLITRWGMSEKSVKRAIRQLCGAGLIEIAEHGYWGKRSRYRLIGELAGPVVEPIGATSPGGHTDPLHDSSGGHTVPSGGHTDPLKGVTQTPDHQSHPRSSNGEDDDDGATHRAPKGSHGAAPGSEAIRKHISETLSLTPEKTDEWIANKLDGRTNIHDVDAYLRSCLTNHLADTNGKQPTKQKKTAGKTAGSPSHPGEANQKTTSKAVPLEPIAGRISMWLDTQDARTDAYNNNPPMPEHSWIEFALTRDNDDLLDFMYDKADSNNWDETVHHPKDVAGKLAIDYYSCVAVNTISQVSKYGSVTKHHEADVTIFGATFLVPSDETHHWQYVLALAPQMEQARQLNAQLYETLTSLTEPALNTGSESSP